MDASQLLDDIDLAIIHCLRVNGRMSSTEMARRIPKASTRVVQYRIEKLISRGVIQTNAIVDTASIGLNVRADVLLSVEVGRIKSIAHYLAEFEEVNYVAILLSNYHIMIGMIFKNNTDLYEFITDKIGSIHGNQEIVLILTPILLKSYYDWHIPGTDPVGEFVSLNPKNISKPESVYELDRVDHRIMNLLLKDCRIPAVKISQRLGDITPRAVRHRIAHLEECGVARFGVMINPRAVGYPVVTDVAIKVSSERVDDVALSLAELKETSYVAHTIGGRDISIQIYSQNLQKLYRFITDVLHEIPGVVDTSIMLQAEQIKGIHDWRIPESIFDSN